MCEFPFEGRLLRFLTVFDMGKHESFRAYLNEIKSYNHYII